MKRLLAMAFLSTAAVAAVAESCPESIISGLSIVDVRSGEVRENHTLTTRDGLIRSVAPDTRNLSSHCPDTVVYDFNGQFALPGLWDMHVHLRGGPDLAEDNRLWMRQFLGYGITSIREAGGDIPLDVLSWKEAINNQTGVGPRIFASLRKVDGSPVMRPGSVELTGVEDIEGALQELKQSGANFIKVNDGIFPDPIFLEVLRQARRLRLRTAAHVPVGVSVEALAEAGLGSIEHAYFLTKYASANEERLTARFLQEPYGSDPFAQYFGMYNAFAASIDDDKAQRNFKLMADSEIAITPTIYLLKRWFIVNESTSPEDDAGYFQTPESILRTHDTEEWIAYLNERAPDRVAADIRMVSTAQRLVGLAAQQGVTILAGSDTGTTNTFMYPGDSLHHELAELVRSGLSPLQAIQSATINAANWFGLTEEAGSIDEGKWADFLILDANPLDDILNSRKIIAVVQFGKLYDQDALMQLRTLPNEGRSSGNP